MVIQKCAAASTMSNEGDRTSPNPRPISLLMKYSLSPLNPHLTIRTSHHPKEKREVQRVLPLPLDRPCHSFFLIMGCALLRAGLANCREPFFPSQSCASPFINSLQEPPCFVFGLVLVLVLKWECTPCDQWSRQE
ncbi:hypothetical protein, unlikely [Trypanosoma congolense IL3000]|uniref:Uncharacterized protein n=1 Tax=Trypanosoma congolense (strain IL3000) TaxID=1068625 RepID=F9WFE2_TRYCI|nr:hypothetical protein, unlikely [Trypanosoma congolense IL3000]